MRAGVQNKENVIPCLLLKFDIAPALSLGVDTLHFNETVHRFANVLGMSRIGKLRSIFKEGVIVAHISFDVEGYSRFDNLPGLQPL
jgi:hypothetical protein